MLRSFLLGFALLTVTSLSANAQLVRLTPDKLESTFKIKGIEFVIARNQDPENRVGDEFSKTSRPCPPFCIHPILAAPGVETLGEIEVMEFLETTVASNQGLLVDTRVPLMYQSGTIPGSVNIPFSTLNKANPFRDEILQALGARQTTSGWDYSQVTELALFCNGPWCDQSPRAIRNLIAAGYPPNKLRYYRGGMQMWALLGLTVKKPL